MKTFKPGDVVKVIAGPRAGQITTVAAGPKPFDPHANAVDLLPLGEPVYRVNLPPNGGASWVVACPHWLEPYWEGKEKSEEFRSAEDILNSLRGKVSA
jgi:hypothetical protein